MLSQGNAHGAHYARSGINRNGYIEVTIYRRALFPDPYGWQDCLNFLFNNTNNFHIKLGGINQLVYSTEGMHERNGSITRQSPALGPIHIHVRA